MLVDQILLSIGFGVTAAAVLAIGAVGLSLQFGITNYVNFAYGDFMALGAYIAWEVNSGVLHLDIWVALVIGAILMGVIAVGLNQLLLAPFARRFGKPFYVLIVTFGLSLVMLNFVNAAWGSEVKHYNESSSLPLHLGPFLLTATQLIVIAISIALMIVVHVLLTVTRLGKQMRAMSDDTSLAMTSGVNTRRVTTITWFLSGAMASLSGTVLGMTEASITPSFGETYLFVIFAAVIVGGIGSIYGAMIGALIIGLATEVSALLVNPAYKLDIAFILLILALLFRPSGLFARAGKA